MPAEGLVVGDRHPGKGQRAASRVEPASECVVTRDYRNGDIAAPRLVVLEDHVFQRDLAAVVQNAAAEGVRRPGLSTVRPIVLGLSLIHI